MGKIPNLPHFTWLLQDRFWLFLSWPTRAYSLIEQKVGQGVGGGWGSLWYGKSLLPKYRPAAGKDFPWCWWPCPASLGGWEAHCATLPDPQTITDSSAAYFWHGSGCSLTGVHGLLCCKENTTHKIAVVLTTWTFQSGIWAICTPTSMFLSFTHF